MRAARSCCSFSRNDSRRNSPLSFRPHAADGGSRRLMRLPIRPKRRRCPQRPPGRPRACRACSCGSRWARAHGSSSMPRQANYLGNVLRLRQGAELLIVRRQLGRMARAHRRGGQEAHDAHRRAPNARAGDDPRRLAGLRAGQAGADRLAGRESDRARRRAADPGDDPADDRRAGQARAAGSDRDRGRRAMRPDASCPRSPSRCRSQKLLDDARAERTLYFADEGGGEPAAAAFRPGPALILTGPEGGFTDEERAAIRAAPQRGPDFARPAHPARRNRRARRARRLHGGRRRLARLPLIEPIRRNRWRGPAARLSAPRMTQRTDDRRQPARSRAATICSSVFAGGEKPRDRLAHRHRAREVRLSPRRPPRAVAMTSPAASATC